MKTLILVITLSLLIVSCNNEDIKGRPIITAKFRNNNSGFCKYYYNGLGYRDVAFEDSCNKYSIGDTL